MKILGSGLGRNEMEIFMDVFNDIAELDEHSFMVCSCCGKQVWNRGDNLCKACSKKLSQKFKKLLTDYTRQISGLKSVVR